MDKAESCGNKPLSQEVEPGTYFWCSCGKSTNQPFCDGAHKGTGFAPVKVVVEEKKKIFWCMCKASKNGAHCDGSHKDL
ncbi:MAG: CDGSH iron-sulfur domain-containing protein [Akkermansiaceae bacterium]